MTGAMLEANDIRNLVSLGFIALFRGLYDHAATIFEGVQAARPTQEAGFIGRALVSLARGEIESAVKTLRALPPTDGARTFLAVALLRQGDYAEAHDILSELKAHAGDSAYFTLASAILDEIAARPTSLTM